MQKRSMALPIIVVLLLAGGVGFYIHNKAQQDQVEKDKRELEKDYAFRQFQLKAYGMRNQVKDQEAWNRWLISEGYRPCITCNGAGRAGGASCARCVGSGIEPPLAKK